MWLMPAAAEGIDGLGRRRPLSPPSLTPAFRSAPARSLRARPRLTSRRSLAGSAFPGRATLRYHGRPGTTADLAPPPLSLGSRRRRGDRRAGELDGRGRRPGCDARHRGRARPRLAPALSALAPLDDPPLGLSGGRDSGGFLMPAHGGNPGN
nr:uncharacterized protein LOC109026361 [Gorilla gorilla gorilla]